MKSLLVLMLLVLVPCFASAGPFTDDLSKCLVTKTSKDDKELLMTWMFAAVAAHPKVKALSNLSEEKAEELSKSVADLFVTLLTDRCKAEAQQAVAYEGTNTFGESGKVLGQVAMQGLMADPSVAEYISGLDKYIDAQAVQKAFSSP